ncbi:vWA domain-containing protein [Alienimonas californiensis]|uniref:VWFA domain-containing protein n=1 Tax=Alienimonas californiensis TaxID=2527989 RepID=A0A517P4H2_9PLAN|nr:vWA domain-containing protein [Alienimonas californiensis]QDT14246.1 hypothetical protein CA12_03170 [Alienimonas californiensis]
MASGNWKTGGSSPPPPPAPPTPGAPAPPPGGPPDGQASFGAAAPSAAPARPAEFRPQGRGWKRAATTDGATSGPWLLRAVVTIAALACLVGLAALLWWLWPVTTAIRTVRILPPGDALPTAMPAAESPLGELTGSDGARITAFAALTGEADVAADLLRAPSAPTALPAAGRSDAVVWMIRWSLADGPDPAAVVRSYVAAAAEEPASVRILLLDPASPAVDLRAGVTHEGLPPGLIDAAREALEQAGPAGKNVVVLFAADVGQRSRGGAGPGGTRTAFAQAAARALAGEADAVAEGGDGNRRVTVGEFVNFVVRRTADWTRFHRGETQRPRLAVGGGVAESSADSAAPAEALPQELRGRAIAGVGATPVPDTDPVVTDLTEELVAARRRRDTLREADRGPWRDAPRHWAALHDRLLRAEAFRAAGDPETARRFLEEGNALLAALEDDASARARRGFPKLPADAAALLDARLRLAAPASPGGTSGASRSAAAETLAGWSAALPAGGAAAGLFERAVTVRTAADEAAGPLTTAVAPGALAAADALRREGEDGLFAGAPAAGDRLTAAADRYAALAQFAADYETVEAALDRFAADLPPLAAWAVRRGPASAADGARLVRAHLGPGRPTAAEALADEDPTARLVGLFRLRAELRDTLRTAPFDPAAAGLPPDLTGVATAARQAVERLDAFEAALTAAAADAAGRAPTSEEDWRTTRHELAAAAANTLLPAETTALVLRRLNAADRALRTRWAVRLANAAPPGADDADADAPYADDANAGAGEPPGLEPLDPRWRAVFLAEAATLESPDAARGQGEPDAASPVWLALRGGDGTDGGNWDAGAFGGAVRQRWARLADAAARPISAAANAAGPPPNDEFGRAVHGSDAYALLMQARDTAMADREPIRDARRRALAGLCRFEAARLTADAYADAADAAAASPAWFGAQTFALLDAADALAPADAAAAPTDAAWAAPDREFVAARAALQLTVAGASDPAGAAVALEPRWTGDPDGAARPRGTAAAWLEEPAADRPVRPATADRTGLPANDPPAVTIALARDADADRSADCRPVGLTARAFFRGRAPATVVPVDPCPPTAIVRALAAVDPPVGSVTVAADGGRDLLFVLDCSGSMEELVGGGRTRMALARLALRGPEEREDPAAAGGVIGGLAEDDRPRRVGLMRFANETRGSERIELPVPPAPLKRPDDAQARALVAAIDGSAPGGRTPLLAAIGQAIDAVGRGGTVVAVTDGVDSSIASRDGLSVAPEYADGSPAQRRYRTKVRQVAAQAARAGVGVVVVGFRVNSQVRDALAEFESVGFTFARADDAPGLARALERASRSARWALEPLDGESLADDRQVLAMDATADGLPPGRYEVAVPADADPDAGVRPETRAFALSAGQAVDLRVGAGGRLTVAPNTRPVHAAAPPPVRGADGAVPITLRVERFPRPTGTGPATLTVALSAPTDAVPDWPERVVFEVERPEPGSGAFRPVQVVRAEPVVGVADPTWLLTVPNWPADAPADCRVTAFWPLDPVASEGNAPAGVLGADDRAAEGVGDPPPVEAGGVRWRLTGWTVVPGDRLEAELTSDGPPPALEPQAEEGAASGARVGAGWRPTPAQQALRARPGVTFGDAFESTPADVTKAVRPDGTVQFVFAPRGAAARSTLETDELRIALDVWPPAAASPTGAVDAATVDAAGVRRSTVVVPNYSDEF